MNRYHNQGPVSGQKIIFRQKQEKTVEKILDWADVVLEKTPTRWQELVEKLPADNHLYPGNDGLPPSLLTISTFSLKYGGTAHRSELTTSSRI
jgi:hypothetical protein